MALGADGAPSAKAMTDLRPSASGTTRSPAPATVAAPAPQPAVAVTAAASPPAATPTTPQPAAAFHKPPSAALDLSQAPVSASPPPEPSQPSAAPEPSPAAAQPVAVATVKAEVEARRHDQLENAQTITQSPAISKFHPNAAVAAEPAATTEPEPSVPVISQPPPAATPAPLAPEPLAPVERPSVTPEPPRPPNIATPVPVTAGPTAATGPTSTITRPPVRPQPLPSATAGLIRSNRRLVAKPDLANVDPEESRWQVFAQALARPKRRANPAALAAAVAVVALLGGYIWLQNYPKLAIRTASDRAGFQASVPTYLPTGYNLDHSAATQPGQVALTFNALGSSDDLTITQRPTDWDSQSLLANYVADQSTQPLVVSQQGLTVYLYNGNEASWVNQGIWYSIGGHNHLNREQLLKIINGL